MPIKRYEPDAPSPPWPYERALVYGDPASGKTRLATSLPESWGKILYIAEDDNAESLRPVLDKYKPRITVVKSMPTYDGKYDPIAEAFEVVINYKKLCEDAGVIVWDTMGATGDKFLCYIAEKHQYSDKQITLGAPSGPGKFTVPLPPDYGGAQNSITRLTSFMMNQPVHIIVVCHGRFDEPQAADPSGLVGGPATVGSATVRTYSKSFDLTVHVEKKVVSSPSGQKVSVTAYTEKHGIWQAKLREGKGENPMPKTELEPDPINFWNRYLENGRA